jgi:hypothetical protein
VVHVPAPIRNRFAAVEFGSDGPESLVGSEKRRLRALCAQPGRIREFEFLDESQPAKFLECKGNEVVLATGPQAVALSGVALHAEAHGVWIRPLITIRRCAGSSP